MDRYRRYYLWTFSYMIIENKMYGGEVLMTFDTFRHQYKVNGEVIPSVTGVLGVINKPALLFWAANQAADYFKSQVEPGKSYDELQLESIWANAKKAHTQKKVEAGNLGTLVHKWVEGFIKQENPAMPVNEQAQGSIKRFLGWVEQHHVKFLASEQPCFSRKYKYAGTIDGICVYENQMYIFDLKTSSGIWDEYLMQVAAYKQARTEEYPSEKYAGCIILRVGKEDGDLEPEIFPDDDCYLNGFLFAKGLQSSLTQIVKRRENNKNGN